MLALPIAAYFFFLEAAAGGMAALAVVRAEVSRGFLLFTGWCLWVCAGLAVWLRLGLLPPADPALAPLESGLAGVFLALLTALLLAQHTAHGTARWLTLAAPLAGLLALAAAALAQASAGGQPLAATIAVMLGALALGSALAGLSLGHWYLVAPTLSVRPLVRLTFVCLAAVAAQLALLPLALATAAPGGVARLLEEHALFFAVRVLFGLVLPPAVAVAVWRTARIRSLDSATGLLYVLATLVLAGEIVARALYVLSGVPT